ncbi:MAG: XRE family transcriptional regulator [Hyphomicrobiales bacterium]|nr:XRE family transcriptional regulator [Hyphomicrobiales bacterium]OQW82801.1 MAG: hypothetical protein BVN31_07540 [Proteobacteria bacterium ST_bin15]
MTDSVNLLLSERLKIERLAKGWSLAQLSEKSQVSRAMISRIERCEVSATASLLAKLADAYGLALADLFAPSGAGTVVSPLRRRREQPVWQDPSSGYCRRAVSISNPSCPLNIVEIDFPAGATVLFDHSGDGGQKQNVWLLEGSLRMSIGKDIYDMCPGDCLTMALDRPLAFHNPGNRSARYAVILWSTTKADALTP